MKTSFLADPLKLQIPPTKKMGVEYKRVEYKHKYKQEPFISYYQVRTSETENRWFSLKKLPTRFLAINY